MSNTDWLTNHLRLSLRPASRRRAQAARPTFRPRLQRLEDRTVLSSFTAATTSALIADIAAANKAGGTNTITLAANSTFDLTTVNNTTTGKKGLGPNGLPVIGGTVADKLTIIGNGDLIERSKVAGTAAFRLFQVATGSSLTLQNVTLQNGLEQGSSATASSAAAGGAIYNLGTLTLSGSTVSSNVASGYGGGIENEGTLTMSASNVSGNSAGYSGGGILNDSMLTVTNSTVQSNTGDGIYNGGTATVSGSNLSYNTSGGGGAIYNAGTLAISGSTLSYNTAVTNGGGIDGSGTGLTIDGTTLSNNTAGCLAAASTTPTGPH